MFVQQRLDMVGLDAAIIMNPKVWEASGHLSSGFADPMIECKNCHERYRADQVDPKKPCLKCDKKNFTKAKMFNLLFKTFIGATEETKDAAYLRGETAQAIFVDFPQILQSTRKRLPFGIAQIGKAFRNEITPGNFIFRTREFEQMEIEYFVSPDEWEKRFEYWLGELKAWIRHCGIDESRIHDFEVPKDELAHYSKRTVDIEFDFPFGREELYGLAYRTDFDLSNHAKHSGESMVYTDPVTGERYVPHVIEPSLGVDRTMLAMLLSAYHEEEAPTSEEGETERRVVLRLPKEFAPIKIAVLPLSKKDELSSVAKPLAEQFAKSWRVDYDETQSIGKRYRRQDEIGTPYCVTVDFESLEDKAVTVRDRDTMKQERVPMAELEKYFVEKF
jgi:glycyl-tRNA synthetase